MPDRRPATLVSVDALDTKVGTLESDLGQLNSRISDLDTKFDRVMTSFASEFRAAIAGLSTQFSERNKTPWGILISGAGVVLTIVALLGHQALGPIDESLRTLIKQMVPRTEVEFRYNTNDRRIIALEADMKEVVNRQYLQMEKRLEALQRENDLLKFTPKP